MSRRAAGAGDQPPFDPARGTLSGKHGAWWIGDYQGLATPGLWLAP
jgi:hypothetical protein